MKKLALAVSVTALLSGALSTASVVDELWTEASVHAHWVKYNKPKSEGVNLPIINFNNNVKHFYYYVRRNY